ncbi:uncharacterized protein EI90DRAFT_3013888 [Cantharellus anzutake]|uniref:uncharacterized protein n=1 Tax=Cantharellus anzutake TaxID=1750568 RepID=UPI001907CAD0|nr:uncharacterized protein EI90DRAFT_3013888 [Cantharellus anzutake]KAF8336901.1 hypothetical protein EI90DRAFT_3013888 [Cantharellus anzutake]
MLEVDLVWNELADHQVPYLKSEVTKKPDLWANWHTSGLNQAPFKVTWFWDTQASRSNRGEGTSTPNKVNHKGMPFMERSLETVEVTMAGFAGFFWKYVVGVNGTSNENDTAMQLFEAQVKDVA